MKVKSIELHGIYFNNLDELKDLDIFDQKKKMIETKKAKMRSWIIKQLRKVKNVAKKDLEFKIEAGDKGLVDAVKKYF